MPRIPLPPEIVLVLLMALVSPTGAAKKATAAEPGCWSDGRKDVLVRGDACPPPLPPLEKIPLWLSWYDPALCYDADGNVIENINCDEDPSTLAGGTPVSPELYGHVGACLRSWFDHRLVIVGLGEWHCLDTGGAIVPTYREIYHPQRGFITLWIIPLDALEHHTAPPWWQYLPIEPGEWQLIEDE